jgi:hypothetical protein
MSKTRLLATAAMALTGVLGVGAAQATDVSWSVTIGSHGPVFPAPAIIGPAPVIVHPVPVVHRAPVVVHPAPMAYPVPVVGRVPVAYPVPDYHRGYRHPTRWDRDGDGIPNRHDRLYNPVWDRDGDGVPNRHDNRHHARHH